MNKPPVIPPFVPTTAPPGTEEKIQIMAVRYTLEQPLWHPQDATADNMLVSRLAQVSKHLQSRTSERPKWITDLAMPEDDEEDF